MSGGREQQPGVGVAPAAALLTTGYSVLYTAHWSLFRSCEMGWSGRLQGGQRLAGRRLQARLLTLPWLLSRQQEARPSTPALAPQQAT